MAKTWNQQTFRQPSAQASTTSRKKTNLDILPVRLDFGQKNVLIYPPFATTGQIDQDMQQLKSYYQGAIGKHAEKF